MPATPKSRLGRGLGGLIAASKPVVTSQPATVPAAAPAAAASKPASAPAASPAAPAAPGYQEVPVNLVDPSPYQARKEIAPEHLSELAESIRSEGLLQPIVVRKTGDRFQLIAGERRWRFEDWRKDGGRALPHRWSHDDGSTVDTYSVTTFEARTGDGSAFRSAFAPASDVRFDPEVEPEPRHRRRGRGQRGSTERVGRERHRLDRRQDPDA